MSEKRFNIREWQKQYLTEDNFNTGAINKAVKVDRYGSQPINILLADWLFTNSNNDIAKKYKFVKANISKLIAPMKNWEHFNRGPGYSIADAIEYNGSRNGAYSNGVYEVYFNLFRDAIAKAGQGKLKYSTIAKMSKKEKKANLAGSKQSKELFGK